MAAANEKVTENGTETYKAPMGLKLLVIGLGIAIVAMLGLIIVKVIAGDHKKPKGDTAPVEQVRTQPLPDSVRDLLPSVSVVRPVGSELVTVTPMGAEVMLRFRLEDGGDTLVFVDRVTGRQTQVIVP